MTISSEYAIIPGAQIRKERMCGIMRGLIIIFIIALPFLMDLWRDQCEYWDLCREQQEEEERLRAKVNQLNNKK